MIDPDCSNRVNIHHHLRDDVVVLLPYVAYRNGTTGFGDGLILPRVDDTSIGEAILRMLDFCATADTRPLEERRDAAMSRLLLGFDLSYAEQCPSFGIADNWGRIYEQYPAIVSNPRVSSRFFAGATVSDRTDTKMLNRNAITAFALGTLAALVAVPGCFLLHQDYWQVIPTTSDITSFEFNGTSVSNQSVMAYSFGFAGGLVGASLGFAALAFYCRPKFNG